MSKMSCLDIMYQPYASYFPYQRTAAAGSSSMEQLKKFGMTRMGDSLDPLGGGGGGGTYGGTIAGVTASSSPSSGSGSVITPKEEQDPEAGAENPQPASTQYLNSNCLLLTYFSGETSTSVDDHFTRSLSGPSSFSTENQGSKPPSTWKEVSPMSQRNFPPSFWNSAYQAPSTSTSLGQQDGVTGFATDPYSHMAGSLHSMSGFQDPWRYPLTSQGPSYSHHMPDLSGYTATSRFTTAAAYSSLLPGSRLAMTGQCDLKHAAPSAWNTRYDQDPLSTGLTSQLTSHHDATTSHLHAGLGGGIESSAASTLSTAMQETNSKDLYWF